LGLPRKPGIHSAAERSQSRFISEALTRLALCLVTRHAACGELRDAHLAVKAEFLVEVVWLGHGFPRIEATASTKRCQVAVSACNNCRPRSVSR
jgi:hypothetical protein